MYMYILYYIQYSDEVCIDMNSEKFSSTTIILPKPLSNHGHTRIEHSRDIINKRWCKILDTSAITLLALGSKYFPLCDNYYFTKISKRLLFVVRVRYSHKIHTEITYVLDVAFSSLTIIFFFFFSVQYFFLRTSFIHAHTIVQMNILLVIAHTIVSIVFK